MAMRVIVLPNFVFHFQPVRLAYFFRNKTCRTPEPNVPKRADVSDPNTVNYRELAESQRWHKAS